MIKFLKIRDVKDPVRNENEDAGIDVYVPEYSEEFLEVLQKNNPHIIVTTDVIEGCLLRDGKLRTTASKSGVYVIPGDDIKIPSGLHTSFDKDIMLKIDNKSGVCLRQKFLVGANIIDSSYQGEFNIHIINYTHDITAKFNFGQKIVQLLPIKINTEKHTIDNIETMKLEDFHQNVSSRGAGGFGSKGLN